MTQQSSRETDGHLQSQLASEAAVPKGHQQDCWFWPSVGCGAGGLAFALLGCQSRLCEVYQSIIDCSLQQPGNTLATAAFSFKNRQAATDERAV